jgi:tRNA (cytidine56-2'-O)-methyltransferase
MPRAARRSASLPEVEVLRIGHRPGRDPRLSTHLALAARAMGARRLYLHPPDPALSERVHAIARRWGGSFEVVGVTDWKKVLRERPRFTLHLTMYGEPLEAVLPTVRREPRILAIVGGAKVPSELYGLADANVAVGHQPHSEVAALAILLDRILGVPGPGAWPGAEQAVVPMPRGKRVVRAGAAA